MAFFNADIPVLLNNYRNISWPIYFKPLSDLAPSQFIDLDSQL